jgi:hypothetical protein
MAKLSRERSLPQLIKQVETTSDARLEQYRNEMQWLTEVLAPPDERTTALMSRAAFVAFLKLRHMDPEGDAGIALLMKSLRQTRPPPSQLQRWLATMKHLRAAAQPGTQDQ